MPIGKRVSRRKFGGMSAAVLLGAPQISGAAEQGAVGAGDGNSGKLFVPARWIPVPRP